MESTANMVYTAITITPISKDPRNPANVFYKEQMQQKKNNLEIMWNDSEYNTTKSGDLFAFYHHEKEIELYHVEEVRDPSKRFHTWTDQRHQTKNVLVIRPLDITIKFDDWKGPTSRMGTYRCDLGLKKWKEFREYIQAIVASKVTANKVQKAMKVENKVTDVQKVNKIQKIETEVTTNMVTENEVTETLEDPLEDLFKMSEFYIPNPQEIQTRSMCQILYNETADALTKYMTQAYEFEKNGKQVPVHILESIKIYNQLHQQRLEELKQMV